METTRVQELYMEVLNSISALEQTGLVDGALKHHNCEGVVNDGQQR